MDLKKVFKKSKEITARDIEGQMIIMPLHRASNDINCIYTLNETAAAAWSLINGKNTLGRIKEELFLKFNVDKAVLEKDLKAFIKDLKSIKAIV